MRRLAHRAPRCLLGDSRGTTVAEYAIILFFIAVVGATAFRIFGPALEKGMGRTGSNFDRSSDGTGQAAPQGAGAAGGAASATHVAAGRGKDTTDGYGGAREKTVPPEESSWFGKLAMIALGVVGGAAAVFAMIKGKHAG
jgi:Flp pilus assembly pilin Flp